MKGLRVSGGACRQRLITAGLDVVFLQYRYDVRRESLFRIHIIDDQVLLGQETTSCGTLIRGNRRRGSRPVEKSLDQVQVHQVLFRIVQKDRNIIEVNGVL